MKPALFPLFVLCVFRAAAQAPVKKDTVWVTDKVPPKKCAQLWVHDYVDKPLFPCVHYDYTATLVTRNVTAALTVDYGKEIPTGAITVAISDTTGKLLQSGKYRPADGKSIVELSSTYQPGEYRILVYGDDRRVLLRDRFQKQ